MATTFALALACSLRGDFLQGFAQIIAVRNIVPFEKRIRKPTAGRRRDGKQTRRFLLRHLFRSYAPLPAVRSSSRSSPPMAILSGLRFLTNLPGRRISPASKSTAGQRSFAMEPFRQPQM